MDLIGRQAAIDALGEEPLVWNEDDAGEVAERNQWKRDVAAIKALPSAERRGRWEHLGGDEWLCTACGHVITTEGSWERPCQKYCEECGARMEAKENEND